MVQYLSIIDFPAEGVTEIVVKFSVSAHDGSTKFGFYFANLTGHCHVNSASAAGLESII